MSHEAVPIRCSILRGGTSRGVFFLENDLPTARADIEPILLDVFGSPDVRQIDGLGGATSQTSKAAIIGPPTRDDADVDYTFAQVSVTDALVDWGGNCGNISSAVGPFAIDQGLVRATGDLTTVRIHNTNTAKVIVAHVPTVGRRASTEGDYAIPGVPGTSARILLEFDDPAGSVTGMLLPTGSPCDTLELADGRSITVSVVDAGNPTVFLRATDLGLTGTESPAGIEAATSATDTLEEARSIIAERLGLVADRRDATATTPGLPKVGFVSPPVDHPAADGTTIAAGDADIVGRLMSMQTAHRSYMTTGAIATAAAAFVPGTIVDEMVRRRSDRPEPDTIRIAHPYGVMHAVVRASDPADPSTIAAIAVGRTARHILDGTVWVRRRAAAEEADPA
ncbi:MAG TPA: PrpF domain-containing protein [Candidatus Saccharimonadales bacterium]|nr:PrpF domain-containing protein [Candidatus Saccharimonadales bacterium]